MASRMPRVTPPSTNSRNREWPKPPITNKSATLSAACDSSTSATLVPGEMTGLTSTFTP